VTVPELIKPQIIQNQAKCAAAEQKADTGSRSQQQEAMREPPTDYTVKNLKRQRRREQQFIFFLNAELGLANITTQTVVTRAHNQIF
jgi:hypothetical protein